VSSAEKPNPRCEQCSRRLLQGGVLRVDHPIRFEDDGTCKARCHFCKTEVSLPIGLRQEEDEAEKRRFVLRART